MKKYNSVKKSISEYKLTIPSNMIIKTKTKHNTKTEKIFSQLTGWGFVYKFRLLKVLHEYILNSIYILIHKHKSSQRMSIVHIKQINKLRNLANRANES